MGTSVITKSDLLRALTESPAPDDAVIVVRPGNRLIASVSTYKVSQVNGDDTSFLIVLEEQDEMS